VDLRALGPFNVIQNVITGPGVHFFKDFRDRILH
jgi:hypothetical protein